MNETNANELPDSPQSKPKRFPGVTSFEDDHLATELFFGREEESQKVLHYILAEQLVVIFSYSGYGKTSLLKAGVFKKLREKNFYPILIRFNKKQYDPVELIKSEIDSINEIKGYEVLHNSVTPTTGNSLVPFFKGLEIWSGDDRLLSPVLVFDQFEEIFTLEHNQKYINSFFGNLADVLKSKEEELNLKMVISIREDFLGHLEKMATHIPNVFTSRFRLEPLKKETARKAIEEPARKTIDNIEFASLPFYFSEEAVQELQNFLSLKMLEGSWVISDDIEPIQLQIICSELENKVSRGEIKPGQDGRIEIQTKDFSGKEGLQRIVDNFYDQQIKNAKDELKLTAKEVDAIKDIIETNLIAGIRRVPLSYEAIVNRPEVNKKAIDLLISNKLLKLESHRGNSLLELSHDTLVRPVLKAGSRRKEEKERARKKRQALRLLLVAIVILGIGGYFFASLVNSKKASQDKYYYAALMAGRENPTLGYKIALDGKNIGYTTPKLKDLLQGFSNGKYAFITSSINFQGYIKAAFFSKDQREIVILGESKTEVWNKPGHLKNTFYHETSLGIVRFTNGNYYTIASVGDDLWLKDKNQEKIKKVDLTQLERAYNEDQYSIIRSTMKALENLLIDLVKVKNEPSNNSSYIDFGLNEGLVLSKNQKYSLLYTDGSTYLHNISEDSFYLYSPFNNTFFPVTRKLSRAGTNARFAGPESSKNKDTTIKTIAVTNDFRYLIYSTASEVRIVDISQFTHGSLQPALPVTLPVEEVNAMAVSPNDSLLLTIANSTGRLWTFDRREIARFKGHQNRVVYAGFSADGKEIVTTEEYGRVFIWKLSRDVKVTELAKFSPFEYQSLGLNEPKYKLGQVYDTSSFKNLLLSTLHYEASIPLSNLYPDDMNYSTSLSNSLEEVQQLYEKVLSADSFRMLDKNKKADLFANYRSLIFQTPYIFDSRIGLDSIGKERYRRYSDLVIKNISESAAGEDEIRNVASELESSGQYFLELKNYGEANRYFVKKIGLYQKIVEKDPSKAQSFNADLTQAYNSLAFYKLFEKDFKGAIVAAQNALKHDSSYLVPYTNMALGYLLNNQFSEAELIYKKYKDSLRDGFLKDFTDLEEANVITEKDPKIYLHVKKIKAMLGGVE